MKNIESIQAAAEANNAGAQFELGLLYDNGESVHRDEREAFDAIGASLDGETKNVRGTLRLQLRSKECSLIGGATSCEAHQEGADAWIHELK